MNIEDLEKLVDRLVVEGSKKVEFTEKGRLDIPNDLPFCTYYLCDCRRCIFKVARTRNKVRKYVGTGIAFGKCAPLLYLNVPSLLSLLQTDLDTYSRNYYKKEIYPLILELYNPEIEEKIIKRLRKQIS